MARGSIRCRSYGWGDWGIPEHSLEQGSLRRKAVPPLPSRKSEWGPQDAPQSWSSGREEPGWGSLGPGVQENLRMRENKRTGQAAWRSGLGRLSWSLSLGDRIWMTIGRWATLSL